MISTSIRTSHHNVNQSHASNFLKLNRMEFRPLPIEVDFNLFGICVEKYISFPLNRSLRCKTKSSNQQNLEIIFLKRDHEQLDICLIPMCKTPN